MPTGGVSHVPRHSATFSLQDGSGEAAGQKVARSYAVRSAICSTVRSGVGYCATAFASRA